MTPRRAPNKHEYLYNVGNQRTKHTRPDDSYYTLSYDNVGQLTVVRATNSEDGRAVHLTLSKPGRKLYQGLIAAAAERDRAFRDCLTRDEKQALERVLTKLAGQARTFIQQEKK